MPNRPAYVGSFLIEKFVRCIVYSLFQDILGYAVKPVFRIPLFHDKLVAAVLSFFWAGLGQIYNGQLAKGIGFMVLYAFSVLLIIVLIGILLAPIVWLIGMWDAYHTAQQYNERQLQNERLYYESLRR